MYNYIYLQWGAWHIRYVYFWNWLAKFDVEPGKKGNLVQLRSLFCGRIGHQRAYDGLFINQHYNVSLFSVRKCYFVDCLYHPTLVLIKPSKWNPQTSQYHKLICHRKSKSGIRGPFYVFRWHPFRDTVCFGYSEQQKRRAQGPVVILAKAQTAGILKRIWQKGVIRTGFCLWLSVTSAQ